ncbi:hypothetical protein B0I18_1011333 [Taibaiella chishuiensis]|uniref:Uncharacterized protein n=2 Tax=Taibaiella chishuiensis TaxID=1434707 RepID=A0A2P8DD66_9BACT|nr:hypothetical protein B0I18_1011333 [Taibaiella chishuiensis]
MCAALAVAAFNAQAGLFVNNNLACDISLDVYASEPGAPTCTHYVWFKVPAGNSVAYNNTGSLTAAGFVWRDAALGPLTPLPISNAGIWDAASLDHYPTTPEVGRPGACAPGIISTGTWASCPSYTLTWTALGGNNVLVEVNP